MSKSKMLDAWGLLAFFGVAEDRDCDEQHVYEGYARKRIGYDTWKFPNLEVTLRTAEGSGRWPEIYNTVILFNPEGKFKPYKSEYVTFGDPYDNYVTQGVTFAEQVPLSVAERIKAMLTP